MNFKNLMTRLLSAIENEEDIIIHMRSIGSAVTQMRLSRTFTLDSALCTVDQGETTAKVYLTDSNTDILLVVLDENVVDADEDGYHIMTGEIEVYIDFPEFN